MGEESTGHFDQAKIHVANHALGGRSSRTYRTEGPRDKVLAKLKPGDFVMMQFGHNDGGSLTEGRARASLKGVGEESQEVVQAQDHTHTTAAGAKVNAVLVVEGLRSLTDCPLGKLAGD